MWRTAHYELNRVWLSSSPKACLFFSNFDFWPQEDRKKREAAEAEARKKQEIEVCFLRFLYWFVWHCFTFYCSAGIPSSPPRCDRWRWWWCNKLIELFSPSMAGFVLNAIFVQDDDEDADFDWFTGSQLLSLLRPNALQLPLCCAWRTSTVSQMCINFSKFV